MANPSAPAGTVVFSTVGRAFYGFDIFSVNLDNTGAGETRLTDGKSVNFNGNFSDDESHTLVFISERSGSARIYLTRPGSSNSPEELPSAPGSLFHDRPIVRGNRVFFVSAHDQPPSASSYKSSAAVYAAVIGGGEMGVVRLTPNDVVDYSPAISSSGEIMAVASYGSKPWGGEFHELATEIVVFPVADPTKRTVLAKRGGWPTWSGDSTVFFHRESDDGWWSVYRVDLSGTEKPTRVTPSGLHAFTPVAMHDGKRIVVATRRKESDFRHIEIFDQESGIFHPITKLINPEIHHYNPFISHVSELLGYHRFRGEFAPDSMVPNLERISSPIKTLEMLRINGNFPSFSSDGDLIAYNHDFESNSGVTIVKSDGSKRWKLITGRTSFYNSWNPSDKNVIFTSIGDIFQSAHATVQIARITFDASSLDPHRSDISNVEIKILTKESTGNNAFPACSPDGKSVVFRSGRSGNKNLFIMDAVNGEHNGGSIRQLTDGPWIDTMPSFSPDGELIAFSSNRHNPENPVTFSIYIIRIDGSGLRKVHVEGSSDVEMERINHVCFSPDGKWLLFTCNMGAVTGESVSMPHQFQPYGDLFVVRVDGSGLRRLTWNAYENGTPTWHSLVDFDNLGSQIGQLSLDGEKDGIVDCDKLMGGQIQDPLWITCDK